MGALPSPAGTALPYPRSFLGLLLAGFTLVALPLATAVVARALREHTPDRGIDLAPDPGPLGLQIHKCDHAATSDLTSTPARNT